MLRVTRHRFFSQAEVVHELKSLAKALPTILSKGKSVSAAAVAVATSHSSTLASHAPNCTVQLQRAPLSDPASTSRCAACATKRAHFLSSQLFCVDFERRCFVEKPVAFPDTLKSAVERSFPSVDAFKETLALFARSRSSPGWTWAVWNPEVNGGEVALANFPLNELPLTQGLWPLAVVNMTGAKLSESVDLAYAAEQTRFAGDAPKWSRAARTGGVAATVPATPSSSSTDRDYSHMRLETVKRFVADHAVAHMNWGFVEKQLQDAVKYYTSSSRSDAIAGVAKEKRQRCVAALERQIADSSSTVALTNDDEGGSQGAPEPPTAPPPSFTPAEVKAAAAEVPKQTETVATALSQASAVSDYTATTLEDGTVRYDYRDGKITLAHPDGIVVYKENGLTTTVHPDGTRRYEYSNGAVIQDNPDGVRVTTTADGTTTESRTPK